MSVSWGVVIAVAACLIAAACIAATVVVAMRMRALIRSAEEAAASVERVQALIDARRQAGGDEPE